MVAVTKYISPINYDDVQLDCHIFIVYYNGNDNLSVTMVMVVCQLVTMVNIV